MILVIRKRSNNKNPGKDFDVQFYRNRHVIENLFAKLKHYKAIAMRLETSKRNLWLHFFMVKIAR